MSSPADSLTRRRVPFWLWIAAATGSAVLLVVSILGWGHGGTATLRAMEASESMPDAQARAVAENTAAAWQRELVSRHLANVLELTCPNPRPEGMIGHEIADIRRGLPYGDELHVVTFGSFSRSGPIWDLSVFLNGVSMVFELHIVDGGLRVCELGSAPVP